MPRRRIRVIALLVISILVLLTTNMLSYLLLLTEKRKWKTELTEYSFNSSVVSEALSQHVYYDGDTIPSSQLLKQYSCSGKLIGNSSLCDVLQGDKIVLLLSPNCCISCAQSEIEKLIELTKQIGHEKLVMVADFALHNGSTLTGCFDKNSYYETDMEHLGLKGSPARESVVVMLTQNSRIKTSFIVCPQTSGLSDNFHKYLLQYFKKRT